MKTRNSFTLIELLVVIAIIGILAGVLIVSVGSATNSANDARRKADLSQLVSAIQIIKTQDGGLPAETNSNCKLGSTNASENCSGIEAKLSAQSVAIPKDPVSGNYYTYNRVSADDFVLIATMSDSSTYSFNSSTNRYTVNATTPTCGTASKAFYTTASGFGTNTFCTIGTATTTPSFPAVGSTSNWVCRENGIDTNCSASRVTSACIDVAGLDCNEYTVGTDTVNVYTLTGTATASTTWTVPTGVSQVEYLVVAGGGGGSSGENNLNMQSAGGGGGAGGLLTGSSTIISNNNTITVGKGGEVASNGDDSVFSSITAIGGGGAGMGNMDIQAKSGGSGGAAARYVYPNGGSGVPGQGYAGGNKLSSSCYAGPGGGGAGGAGGNASSGTTGIDGGPGIASSITGTQITYAKGGKGGSVNTSATGTAGAAASGNGGNGGGNGSTWGIGGIGGSGIVIIKFSTPQ